MYAARSEDIASRTETLWQESEHRELDLAAPVFSLMFTCHGLVN